MFVQKIMPPSYTLRRKPKFTYCGFTIVMSNPSRFDSPSANFPEQGKDNLLSANGGNLINEFCLRPELNLMQCDVRLADSLEPYLEGTKCVLALGEYAMHKLCIETTNNTLNEMRGSPLYTTIGNIPMIASFFPQDAADFKGYEQMFNTDSKEFKGSEEGDFGDDDEEGDAKTHSSTKRSNYAFWLRRDIQKVKRILSSGVPSRTEPEYRIYPHSSEVISVLRENKGKLMYFDIETDYEEQNLLCFAFNFSDSNIVYSIPILDYNYRMAYSNYHTIMLSLTIAIRDNTLVAHNGAGFDFFVLGYKYHISIYNVIDTMIMSHRLHPDIEKSLGHIMSCYTWEVFHKDTDSRSYNTNQNMMDKLRYCGKDVWGMRLAHEGMLREAVTIPGMMESIHCGMASIRPYTICSLQGIKYNTTKVERILKENDRLMTQYNRMISLLVGKLGMDICRAAIKGKAKSFPGSNTQCCNYFHEQLGYSVISRSIKTQKPSLAAKNMYKLRLKYPDNPVISLVMAFRGIQKESSKLQFQPWKDDENNIVKIQNDNSQVSLDRYRDSLFNGKAITIGS